MLRRATAPLLCEESSNGLRDYDGGGVRVVTLVLLAWLVLQRRPGSVDEAQAALAQAADLARVAVAAAEQLYRTGKLPDNDAKLDYALGLLEAQFPALESEQLVATIEAAVYWLSAWYRAMPHDDHRQLVDGMSERSPIPDRPETEQ